MDPTDFSIDLRRSLTPPSHVFVHSGTTTVAPLVGTVCGVGEFFSPPFAACGLNLHCSFSLAGRDLPDDGGVGKGDCGLLYAGGTWSPDVIERHGTYHHYREGALVSFGVTSRLVPLLHCAGYSLRLTVTNRTAGLMKIRVQPALERGAPRYIPLREWDFGRPKAIPADELKSGAAAQPPVQVELQHGELALQIPAAGSQTVAIVVTLRGAGDPPAPVISIADCHTATAMRWVSLCAETGKRIPRLSSDVPGLEAYYRRSILSGLVCLWDNPAFVLQPYVATGGMDGGALACYPWDTGGYVPRMLTLMLDDHALPFARQMAGFGLGQHSRYAPDGTGTNCFYSYNVWSLVHLLRSIGELRGPEVRELLPQAARLMTEIEGRFQRRGPLVDYGEQHNLLEMRGAGWEHFVASPNAERAWCFETLADLAEHFGVPADIAAWRAEAREIRAAIVQELWDDRAGWFSSLYGNGHRETVYSIQAYDALRSGACTPAMTAALLRHVRDGAFLGEYGVSSISAEDALHYELNDPDWSGGGAYSGEGPVLALTLWEAGAAQLAWDVLRRHLWMGQHLLYYPQEHYCDRPAVPAHKRANIISGLAGAEAILFGLAGLEPGLDGSLAVNPRLPVSGHVEIKGFVWRGHAIDLSFSREHFEASVDGSRVASGRPERTPVVPSPGRRPGG